LETRALVERQQARWLKSTRRVRRKLLLRDPDLANGIDLLKRWGEEIETRLRDFILRSRRAKRFRLAMLVLIPPLPFIVLTLIGIAIIWVSMEDRRTVRDKMLAALEMVDGLNAQIVDRLLSEQSLSPEEVSAAFQKAGDANNGNGTYYEGSEDPRFEQTAYLFYRSFGLAFEKANDLPNAIKCATEALVLDRKRILEGGNDLGEFFTTVLQGFDLERAPPTAIDWYIELERRSGDLSAAIRAAEDQRDIYQRVFTENPQPWLARQIWVSFRRIGDLRLERNELDGATAAYNQMLTMARQAVEREEQWGDFLEEQRADLSISLRRTASLKEKKNNLGGAIADYEESVSIDRALIYHFSHVVTKVELAREFVELGNLQGKAGNLVDRRSLYIEALAIIKDDERGGFLADDAKGLPIWLRQEIAKLLAVPILSASQRDWDDCRADDPDQRIAGCTSVLQEPGETLNSRAAAYYSRGRSYEDMGDFDRAIVDYGEAIQLNPKYAEAFNARCHVRAVVGRNLQQALSDCNESLQLWPLNTITLDARGFVYLKLGQFYNALGDYDAVLRSAPKTARALYGRGIAKLRMGDVAAGNSDILKAKAIQGDIADEFARNGVG
jgi:tetratricopeptide (TPR) repeat protein